ncbi:hypothetical protein N1851_015867 [Merluccius polli]|uniref:Uncharacterized protein n=1 Tax=Merluccius polli TaxID=89951 RepID=A0AA47MS88_MERPO|nr:hypothetical protein N1851_015867 [Merluccius polli]
MEDFPSEDHANDLKDLYLGSEYFPTQVAWGLNWNLMSDTFTFNVAKEEKPFTRRASTDPLGFIAPVTIQGKAILRETTQDNGDWDSPLPQGMEEMWNTWRSSLKDLTSLQIPRTYSEISPAKGSRRELIVFCDASTKAIGSVAYLKLTDTDGNVHVGFVMGKAKLAPLPEHTVPRLELCAAVLAPSPPRKRNTRDDCSPARNLYALPVSGSSVGKRRVSTCNLWMFVTCRKLRWHNLRHRSWRIFLADRHIRTRTLHSQTSAWMFSAPMDGVLRVGLGVASGQCYLLA